MSHYELPLVFFTVLAQAAVGAVLVSSLRQYAVAGPASNVRKEWLAASGILLLGLMASIFHLGHPLGAPNALKHLGTAWLSREILGTGVFLGLAVAGALTAKDKVGGLWAVLAPVAGVLAVFFMGMTYSPPSYPALNNALPLVFFLLTALVLGSSVAALFNQPNKQSMVRQVLLVSLVVALVVYLAVPCAWLSGSAVMAATGKAWITSPLYWIHIVLGLALPLFVVLRSGRVPVWLPLLLLVGELLGRAVFFAETMHTATNIGGIY